MMPAAITGISSLAPLLRPASPGANVRRIELDVESCSFRNLLPPDRFSQLAVAATFGALEDAQRAHDGDSAELGLILNTTWNARAASESWLNEVKQKGAKGASPTVFPNSTSAVTIGHVARAFSIRGAVAVMNGTNPIALACRWLAAGRARAVVVLGVEEVSGELAAACGSGEAADYQYAECASALVLERPQTAGARGAAVRGIVLGHGRAAHWQELAEPWAVRGAAVPISHAMRESLQQASVMAAEVDVLWGCSLGSPAEADEIAAASCVGIDLGKLRFRKRRSGESFSADAVEALGRVLMCDAAGQTHLVNSFEPGAVFDSVVVRTS